jgi:hypothetical protein
MITQTLTTSFKQELLQGIHVFGTDVFKLALYTSGATLDADTTVYTTANEVSGTGYTAAGKALTGATVSTGSGVAYVDFADAVWTSAAFTAAGGLIYNSSKANRAVGVLYFGSDKTASTTFTVTMPANAATTALIRLD